VFLGQEKDDQNWHYHHCGGGHEGAPHGAALEHEGLEAEGEGELFAGVEEDQRAGEVVPGEHEAEDGDGCKGRLGKGQDDGPPDAQAGGAVDDGSFFKLHRDGEEELAEHEDVEGRAEHGGDGQRVEGVDPLKLGEEEVEGHEHDDVGDHHLADHDHEYEVAAGRAQAGEAVGGERAGEDGAEDVGEGDEQSIEEVEVHWGIDKDGGKVAPYERIGHPDRREGEDLTVGLERGADHPDKGKRENNCAEYEKQLCADEFEQAAKRLSSCAGMDFAGGLGSDGLVA